MFILPQFQFAKWKTVIVSVIDSYFNYNTLLLKADSGYSGLSGVVVDSSTNNLTVTKNGSPQLGSYNPYGPNGWSGYFDGSSYLLTSSNANLALGTGPYTIEFWVYRTVTPSTDFLYVGVGQNASPQNGGWWIGHTAASPNKITYNTYFGTTCTSQTTINNNQWYHIAISRTSSTSMSMYINGVLDTTFTLNASTDNEVFTQATIGRGYIDVNGQYITGYISNLRIVKGVAVYTGNFTPPTAPLAITQSAGTNIAAITGTQTSLLTLQDNRFKDNSSNALTVTANGTPQIKPASPFTAAYYDPMVNGGGCYFDGSSYLRNTTTGIGLSGSGNFTLECWLYPTNTSAQDNCFYDTRDGATSGWVAFIPSGTTKLQVYDSVATLQTASTGSLTLSAWNHVAIVKNGSTNTYYINGVASGTYTLNSYAAPNNIRVGGRNDGTNNFRGYIANFRTTTTALYTANFTPPTSLLTTTSNGGATPSTAPTSSNVSLLLNFSNAAVTDNSINNNAITVVGSNSQGSFNPFGPNNWSGYFNGSTDYLTLPSAASSATDISLGNFTIECWVYFNSTPSGYTPIFARNFPGADFRGMVIITETNGRLYSYISTNGSSWTNPLASTVIPTGNVWHHIALTRDSTGFTLWYDGTNVATSALSNATSIYNTSQQIDIGSYSNFPGGRLYLNGYISNFRIVKGVAVYTGAFTPPTSPLAITQSAGTNIAAITGTQTSLLTLQDNRFKDNSSGALTVTPNGSPKVQPFAPFRTSTDYSLSGYGGSYYCDGTTSSTIMSAAAAGTANNIGSGDYTIEGWFYYSGGTGYKCFYKWGTLAGNDGLALYTSNNGLVFSYDGSPVNGSGFDLSAGGYLNQWIHIALTRSGSNHTLWINGVSKSTGTSASTTTGGGAPCHIVGGWNLACCSNSGRFNGYISDVRVTKGIALYTATFTPPSILATLPATIFLLQPNVGPIIDSSCKNNLAINGSAQISTTTTKYGTGSMYFDGNSWLVAPDSINLELLNSNFTIEFWLKTSSTAQYTTIIAREPTTWNTGQWSIHLNDDGASTGGVGFWAWDGNNASPIAKTTGISVIDNSWHHISIIRNSSAFTIYVDGINKTSGSPTWSGTIADINGDVYIGKSQQNARYLTGYIDDLRITKGVARYTGNFTVPTALPAH